jgi:hypothetical protein
LRHFQPVAASPVSQSVFDDWYFWAGGMVAGTCVAARHIERMVVVTPEGARTAEVASFSRSNADSASFWI